MDIYDHFNEEGREEEDMRTTARRNINSTQDPFRGITNLIYLAMLSPFILIVVMLIIVGGGGIVIPYFIIIFILYYIGAI